MHYSDIIHFWFKELQEQQWWLKDNKLDAEIKRRFGKIHHAASLGECYIWREEPEGWLAEIIVLDQFSRNIYRNTPHAFAQDAQALTLAQEAISNGVTQHLHQQQISFMYMPFMHSESAKIHTIALELFTKLGSNVDYEIKHKTIIDRFGRYPHRNSILERESTPEELEFLQQADSSF